MARDFNDSTDDIDLSGRLSSVVDNFSLFARVSVTLAQQTGCVIYNGSDSNGYGLFVGSSLDGTGSKAVGLFGGVTWVDPNVTISSDTWTSIGIIRRSGTTYVVADGVETNSFLTNTPNSPGDLASIGQQWNNDSRGSETRHMDGSCAELALWEAALTEAEHGALAAGYSPLLIRPQSLVYYMPLYGNNSPETDIVGGVTGTVNGTTKVRHPRVIMPTREEVIRFGSAAAPVANNGVPGLLGIGMLPT